MKQNESISLFDNIYVINNDTLIQVHQKAL